MNLVDVFVWGGVATVVLTAVLEGAMLRGWTRMSIPYILGTALTGNRARAPFFGAGLHMLNGYLFAFGYALAFESLGHASWWSGMLLGVAHTALALVFLPFTAAVHPRMADEQEGPAARVALQPPGFFALNYGGGTPVFTLLAHLLYGAILGAFYHVS